MRAPFAPLYRLTLITALLCSAASLSAQTDVEAPPAPVVPVVKPLAEVDGPAPLDALVAPDALAPLARPAGSPPVARRAPLAPMDAAPQSPALAPIEASERLVQPEAPVLPEKPAALAAPRLADPVEPVVP
jgi:hypothetical protein